MIKKYTAWLHDTFELVDSARDDIHVLVMYRDYLDLELRYEELQKTISIPVNMPFERVPQHAFDPGFGPVPPEPSHCPHGVHIKFLHTCKSCNTSDGGEKHG